MSKIKCEINFNGVAFCIIIGLLVCILGTIKANSILMIIGQIIVVFPIAIIVIGLLITLIALIITAIRN